MPLFKLPSGRVIYGQGCLPASIKCPSIRETGKAFDQIIKHCRRSGSLTPADINAITILRNFIHTR